jgi:hypothetical protein
MVRRVNSAPRAGIPAPLETVERGVLKLATDLAARKIVVAKAQGTED